MNQGRACKDGEGSPMTLVGRLGFQLLEESLSPEKEPQEKMWYICPPAVHTPHTLTCSPAAPGSRCGPALVPRLPRGPVGAGGG